MSGDIIEFRPASRPDAGKHTAPAALGSDPTSEQVADHIWQMAGEMRDAIENADVLRLQVERLTRQRDRQARRIQRLMALLGRAEAAMQPFAAMDPNDTGVDVPACLRVDLAALRETHTAITAQRGRNQPKDSDDE